MTRYRDWPLGWKLGLPITLVVAGALAALAVVSVRMATTALDRAYGESMSARVSQLVSMTDLYERDLRATCERLGSLFAGLEREPPTLDPAKPVDVNGTPTPSLFDGAELLNGRTERVDHFTRGARAVATIFARSGDDFVRISTSLTDAEGRRAVGTKLARNHPAYTGLLAGKPYTGRATLFGREYMTTYLPFRDAAGAVIGSWFVGLEFSDGLAALDASFAGQRIGESGYVYVVDASSGTRRGEAIMHPTLDGKSLLELRDAASGEPFVATMLERERGELRHAIDANGASTAWRSVFAPYGRWNWLVVATVPEAEVHAASARLSRWIAVLAAAVVALIAGSVLALVRSMVSRPLAGAVSAAEAIAAGDLTVKFEPTCADEAGRLLAALRRMTGRLSEVIGAIERSSHEVGSASRNISSASTDLSQRTEAQASSLAATAATLEQLTATVRQNDDHAREADQLATSASDVAVHGGAVVQEVVDTMRSIREASGKIAEITAVLDDLAFQTNILALNAAVEAARAGDEGRSFALVAAEVRRLALQSDESAKAIKRLIADSAREVEAGARRVDEAGRIIDDVVTNVRRLSEHMLGITAASREQGAGIEQVSEAVSSMDRATRQTAELAEVSAEAAASLDAQARELGREVAVFTLTPAARRAGAGASELPPTVSSRTAPRRRRESEPGRNRAECGEAGVAVAA